MSSTTLHPHRWMPKEGRFYDVAIDGRPVGTVGRWTFERGWWWQHVRDTAKHPRTGRATTRREAVRLLVANDKVERRGFLPCSRARLEVHP